MTDSILVVPKFSSRQTKGKLFELTPELPLTAALLASGGRVVKLRNDLSEHDKIKWWLLPHGGVHVVSISSNDHLRWRKVLTDSGHPGYVVWQDQTVDKDNPHTPDSPTKFGVYSRRPTFNERGAQDGCRWTFTEVGVYVARSEEGLAVVSKALATSGSVAMDERAKHLMGLPPSQRQLAEAARSGFNRECSDALNEANEEWWLWFLTERHAYRNGQNFAEQCRRLHWRQALRRVERPWQLAIVIRECLAHFMVEHGSSERYAAQHQMLEEYIGSAREHAAAQNFDSWFTSFVSYLDE